MGSRPERVSWASGGRREGGVAVGRFCMAAYRGSQELMDRRIFAEVGMFSFGTAVYDIISWSSSHPLCAWAAEWYELFCVGGKVRARADLVPRPLLQVPIWNTTGVHRDPASAGYQYGDGAQTSRVPFSWTPPPDTRAPLHEHRGRHPQGWPPIVT